MVRGLVLTPDSHPRLVLGVVSLEDQRLVPPRPMGNHLLLETVCCWTPSWKQFKRCTETAVNFFTCCLCAGRLHGPPRTDAFATRRQCQLGGSSCIIWQHSLHRTDISSSNGNCSKWAKRRRICYCARVPFPRNGSMLAFFSPIARRPKSICESRTIFLTPRFPASPFREQGPR